MKKKEGMIKKWFMPYFGKHKKVVVLDLFCAALTTLCELVLPVLVREITKIATNDISNLTVQVIIEMAVIYAALKAVDMMAGYYMIYVGHSMGVKIEKDMREAMFAHLLRVPMSYYDSTKVGQLMSRITNDMFDVSEFAHHCPEEFFIAAIKIIVSFAILGSINLPLTITSFAMLPLMFFGTMYFRKKMHKTFKKRRERAGEVNAQTETALLGIRVIKSFTREKSECEKFNEESNALSTVQQASYKYMARLNSVVRFFDGMMYIILILMGGLFIVKGKISTADYAAYLLYVAMLIAAVKRIVEFTEQFEKGTTGIERFAQVMEIKPEAGYSKSNTISNVSGEIEFRNVTFSYDDGKNDVLEHINLKVAKGENIAIVGPSGSGKTTMCSLLSAFYAPNAGQILLDGNDIASIKLASLRNAIGMVEQDVYMFSGTVIENILYGKPNASKDEVIEAAKKAGAHEFIMNLPNGYDTFIGERGTMLSGGQKQRISIARVFLKNPPILVLDEATSALDNKSEQLIKKSLAELAKGRTTFTIAHRLSTIKNADRILVLTENGIEEQGTHEQLLELGGIYSKLYNN
ncbi:MAG: ABC transporter ATP-binding protein/permease [Ruminococcus sp.]|nr:ABC transporter ATP-binding protein/permease [Ruminococcus sp.]